MNRTQRVAVVAATVVAAALGVSSSPAAAARPAPDPTNLAEVCRVFKCDKPVHGSKFVAGYLIKVTKRTAAGPVSAYFCVRTRPIESRPGGPIVVARCKLRVG